jgi:hypothetical protein
LGLNYVLIDIWGNDKNEMIFFYLQPEDLVPYYVIVCRKHLSQSDLTDCKIISIEREEIFFWWGAWIVVNVLKFNRN